MALDKTRTAPSPRQGEGWGEGNTAASEPIEALFNEDPRKRPPLTSIPSLRLPNPLPQTREEANGKSEVFRREPGSGNKCKERPTL